MIGGPKKERQTQNIRFADKASEGGHVGAINVDPSSTRLLEAVLARPIGLLDKRSCDVGLASGRSRAHSCERALAPSGNHSIGCRCSKVSWFGRGLCRLCARAARPRRRRAAEQRDELAPSHGLPSSGQGHTLPQCGERFRSTPSNRHSSAPSARRCREADMAASTTTPYRSNRSRSSHQRRIEDD